MKHNSKQNAPTFLKTYPPLVKMKLLQVVILHLLLTKQRLEHQQLIGLKNIFNFFTIITNMNNTILKERPPLVFGSLSTLLFQKGSFFRHTQNSGWFKFLTFDGLVYCPVEFLVMTGK